MKAELIPLDAITGQIASGLAHADESRPGKESELASAIRHWGELVESQKLDLPLVPEWSAISALSAGASSQFRAIKVTGNDSSVAFSAFLETHIRQYGVPLLMRELPGCRLLCYHPELVAGAGHEELIDAIFTSSGSKCDLIYFPEVVRDGITDRFVRSMARARGWQINRVASSRAPYLALSGTWKDYLASRSSNFRYTLKRKRKALAEKGDVSDQWFLEPESVPVLLKHIETIEEGSWKVGGDMAITRSEQETHYHQLLLPWLARKGTLAANVLFVDSRPVAYSLCYVSQGRMCQAKTSFCEEFANCSPGLLVTSAAIEYAHEKGFAEFDFLGDAMIHKATWTKSTRDHDHLYVYTSSIPGRVVGMLKRVVQGMRRKDRGLTVGRSGLKDPSPQESKAAADVDQQELK